MVITYSKGVHRPGKGVHRPGKVAYPARGKLSRKIDISLSQFARNNLVSRDGFGRPVPRQPSSYSG